MNAANLNVVLRSLNDDYYLAITQHLVECWTQYEVVWIEVTNSAIQALFQKISVLAAARKYFKLKWSVNSCSTILV